MGKATEDPKNSKRNLLDDSDSESEDGGAAVSATGFKVNEDFARRFEHNKKREERQRLEEKFKKTGKQPEGDEDDDESSSDEEEDEDGFLATEDLDAQISATLQAIRNKDPKVYDKEVTFYKPDDPTATTADKERKEKPVFLKDYHREKYLRGDTGADDEDEDTPMTYNQEQDALKKSIVAEMHAAAESDDSDDEDGGFMKKKAPAKVDSNGVHPSRKAAMTVTEVDVANADKNPENFLSNFMSARAWVPPDGSNWKAFESDDGEDDNDQADQFEQAYNLRFEDPERSNEFLRSYARDVAAAKSVRREEKSGRKRQRELERERKEAEKRERREEKARLRKLKLDEAQERLRKIKRTAGSAGKDLTDEEWIKFLDDAWEDDKWEEEMQKRFGDDYYAQQDDAIASDEEGEDGEKKSKHPKKPKWDDDIDIKDIIPDFEDDEEKPKISLSDAEDGAGEEEAEEDDEEDDGRPSKKRKTDHKKARKESQKQARQERAKLEALVDAKLELSDHALLKQPSHAPFRYRETSPQSFGMTARDILLAPSDAALNDYAGLKKLATFRDQEKKRKDKKRLGKKARLRQWRRDIFGKEFEREGPTYGFERLISANDEASGAVIEPKDKKRKQKKDDEEDSNVVGDVGERKKKRKRSKGKKGTSAAAVAEE
ncbi:Kinetochore protein Spc24 [Fusarium torreyae]|uniref:Kinetochore protein Spc24 n=1 Tax=Fusarium torreyae TaxID=1237075 RepID=A0A9W8S4U3_9HYPO|nr:Kinetochore protein Spc24 [Fusarium torreyae]